MKFIQQEYKFLLFEGKSAIYRIDIDFTVTVFNFACLESIYLFVLRIFTRKCLTM